MTELSTNTDGLMLDLSYDAIRTAMVEAGSQPEVQLAGIDPISAIDLESVRVQRKTTQQVQNVNLAVVPHMPLTKITFDARHPAVRVSTALRTTLSKVPGVRVSSPRDIREQLRRLRGDGIDEKKTIRGLAARLGVDFVVWGELADDAATVQTAAYRRSDGQPVASLPISLADNSGKMAYALISASAREAPDDQALSQLLTNMNALGDAIKSPMSANPAAHDQLLTAMEALEQALEFEAGNEQSAELLDTADEAIRTALSFDKKNSIPYWLRSNVAYNQAAQHFRRGEKEAGEAKMKLVKSSLSEAFRYIESLASQSLRTEIEADYVLLDQRDGTEAAGLYRELIRPNQPLESQLRGHWMLSGIHAGDWGMADQGVVDTGKARGHVVEIMANWSDSPESKLLKQWLQWDDSTEQTEFNYLPRLNMDLD